MNKQELISELKANQESGIAFGQDGILFQIMDFREFLDWYRDTEYYRYSTKETEDGYEVVERSSADRRKVYNREQFDTEEEAEDYIYERLEMKYNDDNGSGGIWYPAPDALSNIEAGEYDEYFSDQEA